MSIMKRIDHLTRPPDGLLHLPSSFNIPFLLPSPSVSRPDRLVPRRRSAPLLWLYSVVEWEAGECEGVELSVIHSRNEDRSRRDVVEKTEGEDGILAGFSLSSLHFTRTFTLSPTPHTHSITMASTTSTSTTGSIANTVRLSPHSPDPSTWR
jgi:hypothetical protein